MRPQRCTEKENPLGLARTSGFLPQRWNSLSAFLAAHTDGERNATLWHFPTISQCVRYGFCRVGCCVRSSAKNQGKKKKKVVGTSTCKSKTTEGAVPQTVWRLAYPPKKFFGYFRMTFSSFNELLSMIRPKLLSKVFVCSVCHCTLVLPYRTVPASSAPQILFFHCQKYCSRDPWLLAWNGRRRLVAVRSFCHSCA